MGRGIIKIKNKYFEWSTVVDAPISTGMSLDQLTDYIKEEYGNLGLRELPDRLKRVEQNGSSFVGKTLEETIRNNCAGTDGSNISADEIYDLYSEKGDYES